MRNGGSLSWFDDAAAACADQPDQSRLAYVPEDHSTCWRRSKASAMLSGAAYARSRRITFVRNALTRKTSAAPQRVPLQNRGRPR